SVSLPGSLVKNQLADLLKSGFKKSNQVINVSSGYFQQFLFSRFFSQIVATIQFISFLHMPKYCPGNSLSKQKDI
ncbi:hypothetical protein NDU88_003922, partial [Pleurodeles waltl]